MDSKFAKIIKEYQCCGCSKGYDVSCFESNPNGGIGCGNHYPGTIISGIGAIFLGMPKGFNRVGKHESLKPYIFESLKTWDWGKYDKFNIPVWKYLSPEGHTFVRGLIPRRNEPFIHIFLENCMNDIDCLEITQEDIDAMD